MVFESAQFTGGAYKLRFYAAIYKAMLMAIRNTCWFAAFVDAAFVFSPFIRAN